MYYILHGHCKLVKGACRAAIYDLRSGKVWSINHAAFSLLDHYCKHPMERNFFFTEMSEAKLAFFRKLTEKNLGEFYLFPSSNQNQLLRKSRAKLHFLWLELTSACNNRCLHCYSSSTPLQPKQYITLQRWKSLLAEARAAGAEAIQFIGGEPLLYPKWQEIVAEAAEQGYSLIEIFTNATLIDNECIQFLKKYNVNIATTIYADNAHAHNKITQNPESFEKTMHAIDRIQTAGLPLRIASIIMKQNEDQLPGILSLYKKWNMNTALPDVIRPTGRGTDEDLLPLKYERPHITPPFYTNEWDFTFAHYYHPCLAGKLAITSIGDVIPCIFARSQICGNITTHSLSEILQNKLLISYWETTKDQTTICKDCEYRYACHDCRPLAQSLSPGKDWLEKPPNCFYDPYKGVWSQ